MESMLHWLSNAMWYRLRPAQPQARVMWRFSDGSPVPDDGKRHADPGNPCNTVKIVKDKMPPEVVNGIIIGRGNIACIGTVDETTVLKFPQDDDDEFLEAMHIERQILTHLGDHPRIIRYLGYSSNGTYLRRAENGDLETFIKNSGLEDLPTGVQTKWVRQLLEGVTYIHLMGIIHCDLGPRNVLVDKDLNLVLSDFGGSYFKAKQLDGKALESVRYCLPRDYEQPSTIRSDLFALGCTIYFVLAGRHPYESEEEAEVQKLYENGHFPATDTISLGTIISDCWTGNVESAADLLDQLKVHMKRRQIQAAMAG
ncbi:hypothetical protein FH972_024110 [Carpinus fangiana]|uniref:Protein kinase domain-containing protein n=1 Tax=Carpinus fangiana TaxID=176857 RepID=A0A5N6KXK5_9ROSI|nr:hypothetical protein FH972_024110 [Carpinus fangiana]